MSWASSLTRLVLFIAFTFHLAQAGFSQPSKEESNKDQYVLISSGLLFSKSKIVDTKNLLETKHTESFTIKAAFQRELQKRIFLEAGLIYNDYWIGFKRNDGHPVHLGQSVQMFGGLEGSFGFMYKIQTRKNKDVLNVHLGVFSGYAFSSLGHIGNVGYTTGNDSSGGGIIEQLDGNIIQHSNLILGNAIGISRDFRITRNLFFGLNFNYNLGYNKLSEIDIRYVTSNNVQTHKATSTLSATSWQSLVYIKVRINQN